MSSLTIDSGFDGAASSSSTLSRQSQPTEFTIQKEDFPALSTLAASGSGSDKSATPRAIELKRHASFTISAADNAVLSSAPARSGATAIGVRAGSASAAESSSNGVSLSGGAFGHLRTEEVPASGVSGMDASNQFGLLGMLHTIIRPGNEAKKNLTMGCDLTSLGLNLNSAECVPYRRSKRLLFSLTRRPDDGTGRYIRRSRLPGPTTRWRTSRSTRCPCATTTSRPCSR
jgi:CCR4-NOT transcription complex subunit 2